MCGRFVSKKAMISLGKAMISLGNGSVSWQERNGDGSNPWGCRTDLLQRYRAAGARRSTRDDRMPCYWSWREIEGRRCWYKGHRRIDKKLLSWGPRKPAEGAGLHPATLQEDRDTPSSTEEPIEAEPVYRPAEPLVGSMGLFETAWRDLMADMKFQDRIKMEEADPPAR
jgi:hypothetical protein